MKRVLLTIIGLCVLCVGALHAQSPVRGVTVNGAYDTLRTIETTPRFVGPTGELHRYPALTINGQILPKPDLTALTFEAMTAGAEVTFTPTSSIPTLSIEYSLNGGAWTPYTDAILLANVGDKVSFRGNNTAYSTDSEGSDYCSNFSCSDSCYLYGNIMSLVDATNYSTNTTLTGEYAFSSLFDYNDYIFNHPTQMLFLPATTLTDYCYSNLFAGCTELTIAPVLPATTLTESCYAGMFNNCLSLTTVPELPATTLQENCYRGMFENCTSLTTVSSELPATTLAEYCYEGMFRDCISLTKAPALPATTMQAYCYADMFYGCTSLTTVPSELPATILAESCYESMFQDCTDLTTAPALPATTLANYCYDSMFYGDTSLTTVPSELPATQLAAFCYYNMFGDCKNLTTAPILPATTLVPYCYKQMFYNCTSLTTAPDLIADTLVPYCYVQMFQGCSNLNNVTCLALDINTLYTTEWLENVAPTGTFVKAVSMTGWPIGSSSGIPSGWTVTTPLSFPLTFEAKEAGAEVTFTPATSLSLSIEYSLDGVAWTTYTTPITLANVGDKVYFRGNNATYANEYVESNFSFTGNCYVYGNIMSLVDASDYATNTTLTGTYTFSGLFFNNTKLYSHPTKAQILPATTLTKGCYNGLFNGCTKLASAPELPATVMADKCYLAMFRVCSSLTSAPKLPATTLSDKCYEAMFMGCSGLTTAPELPATTLSEDCYSEMFENCENLTVAPELSAPTLVDNCYYEMFNGCTNLNSVTCLATDILAPGCLDSWLNGVATSGTFYKASAMTTGWETGVNVPSGWTIENK